MQSVSKQRLGKHISAYRTVLCNAVTSSTIQTAFLVESMQSVCKRSEFRKVGAFESTRARMEHVLSEL
jgi:hypothetical protein